MSAILLVILALLVVRTDGGRNVVGVGVGVGVGDGDGCGPDRSCNGIERQEAQLARNFSSSRFPTAATERPTAGSIPNMAKAHWLTEAVTSHGARCLDGSPPLYYLRKATSEKNSTKWVFHIQGGAWCTSIEDCFQRAHSRLGSSNETYGYLPTVDLRFIEGCNNSRWCGSIMVNDKEINPIAYDWNAVFIQYCDGGSFTGNNDTVTSVNGQPLYFRGYRNLQAIFDDLLTNEGLKDADSVILGGDSAGGLATYIHTDYIHSLLSPETLFAAVPDSGFFMDLGEGSSFHDMMDWIYHQMNSTGSLNEHCSQYYLASNHGDTSPCMFAEHMAPFINSPLFALQGRFDAYQTSSILHSDDPSKVNPFGERLVTVLFRQLLAVSGAEIQGSPRSNKHGKGAFIDSCHHHCGYWSDCIGVPINETTTEDAIAHFWATVYPNGNALNGKQEKRDTGYPNVWYQERPFPCTSCCGNGTCALP